MLTDTYCDWDWRKEDGIYWSGDAASLIILLCMMGKKNHLHTRHTYIAPKIFEDFFPLVFCSTISRPLFKAHIWVYTPGLFSFSMLAREFQPISGCAISIYFFAVCGFKTALLFVAQLLCVHKISTNFLRQSQPQIKYVFNFCILYIVPACILQMKKK